MNKIILFALIGLGLSACSVGGNITDETQRSTTPMMGTLTGFVSGSKQNETTTGGYTVSASLGNYASGIKQQTDSGYTVYSSVQGNIVSESYQNVVR
ncbi:MAG: hypothetical protein BroJett040_16120 [Oligoflexia bacterium]|nr:MAG: hypothetical protein BroJett040_16120 [Oligoflexia bacterium]